MSRISNDEKLANLHEKLLRQFNDIQSVCREERKQCLSDRRFYSIAGAQWEGPIGEQFENKPKFEVNKIHLNVIRIFNEYRNNRITVDFVSADGSSKDGLADACDGLYRADEQDGGAEEAYDNAFEEAIGGGLGAWRLRSDYEDDEDPEDERQRIRFEPIYDADSTVFFDVDAKKQDKSDAKTCFVLTSMTRDAYIEEYNDDPASWPKEINAGFFDWSTPDSVYIAEVYKIEIKKYVAHVFKKIDGSEAVYSDDDFEDDESLRETLSATGAAEIRKKKISTRKCRKYILSGGGVLEDCGYIAGNNIPVIPVYGKRWYVDNIERVMGHVRIARDTQVIKNMQLSKLGEISALSSIEKPIFVPEQIVGHQTMWKEDNVKNYPYLLVNPITDLNGNASIAGPIAYTKPPQIPPAMAALLQITESDMRELLGNQDQSEKMVSNISGKAVEMIQTRLDMQTYIYMSNMSKAIRRCGEIWLSMAKDIYVEAGRKMKTVGSQGESSSLELMRNVISESGAVTAENDLSKARLQVSVDVGPSSSSRRAATVRALTGMMQITQDPETTQVLGAMAMMNMEGEGISDVREYFRGKLVKLGVIKPTPEEAKSMTDAKANAKPDPNALYLQAAAEEAAANATQARAKTVLTIAQAEETKAKTLQIATEIDATEQEQAMSVIEKFSQSPQVQQQPVQAVVAPQLGLP